MPKKAHTHTFAELGSFFPYAHLRARSRHPYIERSDYSQNHHESVIIIIIIILTQCLTQSPAHHLVLKQKQNKGMTG